MRISSFGSALSFFMLLSFFSCQKMLLKSYGIKQPAIENYETTSKFLKKYKIEIADIYGFADTTAMQQRILKRGLGIPETYFFNKKGFFVPYKESAKSCNAGVSPFISSLDNNFNTLPIDENWHIEEELSQMVNIKTRKKIQLSDFPPSDVYAIMYCAAYVGKLNKEKTWDWLNHLKEIESKTQFKITVILVSADYMDFWNVPESQLPKFK